MITLFQFVPSIPVLLFILSGSNHSKFGVNTTFTPTNKNKNTNTNTNTGTHIDNLATPTTTRTRSGTDTNPFLSATSSSSSNSNPLITDTTSTESNNDNNNNNNMSSFDSLTFLSQICGTLKKIKRTGWVRSKIPLPESDADHMHRCAMCAMLVTSQNPLHKQDELQYNKDPKMKKFHPTNINSTKLLKMALTHDVCESIAGDVTPFCTTDAIASKYEKEKEAMVQIRNIVGDPLGLELFELWKEYEEQITVEALYCKDIDKFEMVMQAYEYEQEHLGENLDHRNKKNSDDDNDDNDDDNEQKDITNTITPLRTFYITTNDKMKSPLFRRLDAELRQKREVLLKERGWVVTEEEKQNY